MIGIVDEPRRERRIEAPRIGARRRVAVERASLSVVE
jgi:hypothetical protein